LMRDDCAEPERRALLTFCYLSPQPAAPYACMYQPPLTVIASPVM